MCAPTGALFDAATSAAVLPLPYSFDESFFFDAASVGAAPVEDVAATHVALELVPPPYVQFVSFCVELSGFMPDVLALAFAVCWLDADVWFDAEVWFDADV
jgi:hypothetical protein